MGSRSEICKMLGECRFGTEGQYLEQVLKTQQLPIVARVSQGSYASLSHPSHILILSAGSQLALTAQCVKFKVGRRRATPIGPTLLIPQSYAGHFEILNEEGRAVPSILTVEGLSKALPPSCLVREPFKCHLAETRPDGNEKTYRIGSKTRQLLPGQLLTLVGQVSVPSGKGKVSKYLRCIDQEHTTLFLPCTPKGKFSPLATEDSITGVHTTRGILNKRLPLMVRLVEGRLPSARTFKFFPELRLYSSLQEQLLFAFPLTPMWKESLVPLPPSAPLKLQVATNMDEVECCAEYHTLLRKATSLLHQVQDNIQIYDMALKKELRFDGMQWKSYAPPLFFPPSDSLRGEKEKSPDDEDGGGEGEYEDIDQLYDYIRGIPPSSSSSHQKSATTLVTITSSGPDVIAHITASGQVPKPPRRNNLQQIKNKSSYRRATSPSPPVPPPIETIPSRKFLSSTPDLSINLHNNNNNTKQASHHGTQIQIQIRSRKEDDILITSTSRGKLDSTGGSVSTTPTNTSGSAQSSSSSKSKSRPNLYIKHHHHHHHPSPTHYNPLILSNGRAPPFPYRYKSLTDLSSPSSPQPQSPLPLHHLRASEGLLIRPKSLTSLESPMMPGGGMVMLGSVGVKKRLIPWHTHTPTQGSGRQYRKNSLQHSSLFL